MAAARRAWLVLWFSSLPAAFLTTISASLAAQEPPRLVIEPYTLRSYDGRSQQIELGRLTVPESRDRAHGATISLAFFRLTSTSPSPGSPIVFLMGGPGIPATVMAPIPPYWELFDRLRAVGDVILLDQRGVGLSSPKLDCPALTRPPDSSLLSSRSALVAAFRNALASCASQWRERGSDPTAYTDDASADDVDDVRRALGAERVSLLGFSYGTRLALAFARRHPDRLDRLVLQGPEDPDLRYRSSLTADSLFAQFARLAAADSASAPFSQDLRRRLGALLALSSRTPFVVHVRSPRGDSLSIPVGKEGLQALIAERVGDPRLPALVATLERGDKRLLVQRVEAMYGGIAAGAGSLMARAVDCSALPSGARTARVDAQSKRSILGLFFDNQVVTRGFCDALGEGGPADHPRGRVSLTGPALIIVGQLDDQTPMGNAAVVAGSFSGSVRLVVENGGHELLTAGVVREAVVDFLSGRDVSGRHLRVDPPRFLSIEEALRPPRRPGF